MSYTCTWGGSSFTVNPDLEGGINITPIEYGSQVRTANLTLRQDSLGTKHQFVFTFTGITATQLAAIYLKYLTRKAADTETGSTLVLDSESWTVKAAIDGWKRMPTSDGGASGNHYGCTITLDEV